MHSSVQGSGVLECSGTLSPRVGLLDLPAGPPAPAPETWHSAQRLELGAWPLKRWCGMQRCRLQGLSLDTVTHDSTACISGRDGINLDLDKE